MTVSRILFVITIIAFVVSLTFVNAEETMIIDSDMTFAESIKGTKAPQKVIDQLCLLDVYYYSFDDKLHKGQLVVNKKVKMDVAEIFEIIKSMKFKVKKAIPIVEYKWSDDASMADNNSSAFCYRYIAGTKRMSNHSYGMAVDINPCNNPVVYKSGRVSPKGAKYNPKAEGTFSKTHPIVRVFLDRGWIWGGDFRKYKDNHHFAKKK
ncbi:MAG: M15 family metallopeptidase [Candidatus Kapabacteria bacterium]|jgi:peptidoglycan L-alanyl-D-glutamate endopeptidase CwlK|nr:M15 family metallopeptidase [Candidatus Kapabacteria bacterium]